MHLAIHRLLLDDRAKETASDRIGGAGDVSVTMGLLLVSQAEYIAHPGQTGKEARTFPQRYGTTRRRQLMRRDTSKSMHNTRPVGIKNEEEQIWRPLGLK